MSIDKTIEELRSLNRPVPKPMTLPSKDEIESVQQELSFSFHPDYIKYLLSASDVVYGTKEPCSITIKNSSRYLVTVANDAWGNGVPREIIPICEDNGDYYCITGSGEVVFWTHNGISDERWADLATWIKQAWINEG